ncbi:MAG: DUF434 domain-containing protein [Saprospiraceae bacterium]|nr:DUF434 domain-containing protein [Saprospiraceae bacterium]
MPDKRKHRGQHPQDASLFAEKQLPNLRIAVEDFSYLLTKGYAPNASLKLVGDRFRLKERQRMAVRRCGCDAMTAKTIAAKECSKEAVNRQSIELDGFNVLIIVESALSGGLILKGYDHCYKDLASIHSTYKKVLETEKAIEIIGNGLEALEITEVSWFLDRPVSNSGRLKQILLAYAEKHSLDWEVHLVFNPDKTLIERQNLVASSDSIVVRESKNWFNLTGFLIDNYIKNAQIIDLN